VDVTAIVDALASGDTRAALDRRLAAWRHPDAPLLETEDAVDAAARLPSLRRLVVHTHMNPIRSRAPMLHRAETFGAEGRRWQGKLGSKVEVFVEVS
jgi:hypothetical protein